MRYSYTFFISYLLLIFFTMVLLTYCEIWTGISLPRGVYLTLAAVLAVPVILLAGGYWWKPGLTGYLVCLVGLYSLYAVPWNARKAFQQDSGRVRTGMTAAEVDRVLAKHVKEAAAGELDSRLEKTPPIEAVRPESGGVFEFADAAGAHAGAEGSGYAIYRPGGGYQGKERCVIRFEGGHVVSVEYRRD